MAFKLTSVLGAILPIGASGVSAFKDTISSCNAGAVNILPFKRSDAMVPVTNFCHNVIQAGPTSETDVDLHIGLNCGSDHSASTQDLCTSYFQNAIDNCDTNTIDAKYGNIFQVYDPNDSTWCWKFWIIREPKSDN